MIILKFLFLAAASWASPEWQCLMCEVQNTYVYEKKGPTALIQMVADKDVAVEWKSKKRPSLEWVKKISQEKEKALSLVGIKKWTLVKHDWLAFGEKQKLLQLLGYYVDRSNNKIYFQEMHQFEDKASLRVLLTSESKADLLNTSWKQTEAYIKKEMSLKQ